MLCLRRTETEGLGRYMGEAQMVIGKGNVIVIMGGMMMIYDAIQTTDSAYSQRPFDLGIVSDGFLHFTR